MTTEELSKLNRIKSDIDELTRSYEIINGIKEGSNKISLKISGFDHIPQVQRVPGLSDRLQYVAEEMIGERIDELERQLMSFVLCTVEPEALVYSPANITDETKKTM